MSFAEANDMLLFFNLLINTVNRNTIGCSDFLCNWITKMKSNHTQNKTPNVIYVPQNSTQKALAHKFDDSKIIILSGIAGGGKTSSGFGESLKRLIHKEIPKLTLCRPALTVDEDLGHLPGSIEEKLMPFFGPFSDVLENMSFSDLSDFPIEIVSAGMLRGRSFKGILLIDEAQNLTYRQLVCACTRINKNGKLVLIGDGAQSDIKSSPNHFELVTSKLANIEGVSIFRFTESIQNQLRYLGRDNRRLTVRFVWMTSTLEPG